MLTLVLLLATQQAEPWHQLAKGIEYRQILIDPANPAALLHAVRFEVDQIEFRFALRSKAGGAEKTVGKWVDEAGFLVGINAGMFGKDRLTNIGRLVDAEHRNQSVYNDYQSALVFAPKQEGLPYAQILDLDVPGTKETASHYHSMVQICGSSRLRASVCGAKAIAPGAKPQSLKTTKVACCSSLFTSRTT